MGSKILNSHTHRHTMQYLSNTLTNGYMAGKLLVATPLVNDDYFARSVIYLLSHDEEGAMGIIINHTIKDMHCSSVLNHLNISYARSEDDAPVYFGGPVESARGFILHTDDSPYNAIALSANVEMLKEIASGDGPRKSLFALGYAEWEAGQLDMEIQENSWIVIPATEELVFDANNATKWSDALKSLGIDIKRFSNIVGHA